MKIQMNSDKQVVVDAALANGLESNVRRSLERFAAQLTRVEVHLSDLNSGKPGLRDKRCQIEVRPAGRKPVSVMFDAGSVEDSVRGATGKMKRLLESTFGRTADRVSRSISSQGKRALSSRQTLEKLGRIEAALSEVLESSKNDLPRLEGYVKTATDAVKRAKAFVETNQSKESEPIGSQPAPKAAAASAAAGGHNPKKKGIYRARRKAWPAR